MHSFLKELKKDDTVDCVYVFDQRNTNLDTQITDPNIIRRQTSNRGTKYVKLNVQDNSIGRFESAEVLVPYNSANELDFLNPSLPGYSNYLKVSGVVLNEYPKIRIWGKQLVPANADSGIIFDTSNLYSFSEYYQNKLLSPDGWVGPLRHTSTELFQECSDIIDIGSTLRYERIINSPYDKYQVNVYIEDIEDEVYTIPAYLTPTMGKMIDNGYQFEIIVADVTNSSEDGRRAGVRVNVKGYRK